MPLHVLRHVVTQQFDAHDDGKLAADLGLADARRPGEQEAADRLLFHLEPRARQLDGRSEHLDRLVLPEHDHLELLFEALERLLVRHRDLRRGDARDLRHHLLHVAGADGLLALGRRQDALRCAGFVDDIDGLVRHEPVRDVARSQFGGGT